MTKTRSNLEAASIYEVNKAGNFDGGTRVDCMFNPYEYSVSKSNSFAQSAQNAGNTPDFQFRQAGPQTLRLHLYFDTYESNGDVSSVTSRLWKLMEPKREEGNTDKKVPPRVAFEWGVFLFRAVITDMTQKFTLFTKDGTPVRAQVDVTFTQYRDEKDYKNQNPTSGGGEIERVWTVVCGDRIDGIAASVYGEPSLWRAIAEYNNLRDPLRLLPGQQLIVPARG